MDRELVGGVTGGGALALLPLAVGALYLADLPGLLGVLAGGGVVLGNFRWLTSGSRRALTLGSPRSLGVLSLGLRHLSVFAALGVLLASGYVHPVGLMVGVSVLPPVLLVQALRLATRNR